MTLQTHNLSYWLELAEKALSNIAVIVKKLTSQYNEQKNSYSLSRKLKRRKEQAKVIIDTIDFINNIKDDNSAVLYLDEEQVSIIKEWSER